MAAIYLSQVRSSFIVVAVMVLVLAGLLMSLKTQRVKAVLMLALYAALILAAFSLAVGLGGQSVRDRFTSLLESDPVDLFYTSRGEQLEYGFRTLLTDYPFGAGLGRWGMINVHFGDPYNFKASPIWAEVQPNAWILDGGVLLLALYGIALVVNTRSNIRMILAAQTSDGRLAAVAVLAANVGTLALTVSFTPFSSQIGLQYWLLSGALHGAMAARGEQV
jgi:hypothetical protein